MKNSKQTVVPTFLYVPYLAQGRGIEMHVRGQPTVSEVDLMIEFLEFSKCVALPDVPPSVLDTIATADDEHRNMVASA